MNLLKKKSLQSRKKATLLDVPPFCLRSANHRRLHCSSDFCESSYPKQRQSSRFFFFFSFSFSFLFLVVVVFVATTADITQSLYTPSEKTTSPDFDPSVLPSSPPEKEKEKETDRTPSPSHLDQATSSLPAVGSTTSGQQNRPAQTSHANHRVSTATATRRGSDSSTGTAHPQRCILRPPAVRLANPVNHVPRVTPVSVPRSWQLSDENLAPEVHRDAHPLLSIPERRRSRWTPSSPSSLVVERSQGETESWRTSIGLPPGKRSSREQSKDGNDAIQQEMAAVVGTTTTVEGGSAAENLRPPEQAYMGQNNPSGPQDLQQPRHVPSQTSLRSQSQIASIPSYTGQQPQQQQQPQLHQQQHPDIAEELAWGPGHPCFPHINPHVPVDSQEYVTTRVIRIRRDWMVKGDLAPTFSNLYPEILDPLLSEQEFRKVIAFINDELVRAFDPYRVANWIDAALGLVTGWVWEDLGAPAIKRDLRRVEAWIDNWNREVGAKDGVYIWSLRRTAYMSLDIQIPDPKVGIIPSEPSLAGTRPSTGIGGGR